MTSSRSDESDQCGWIEGVDVPTAARGASRGFSVLLIGGLLWPIPAAFLPSLGAVWLTLTAIVAFILAAGRIENARRPTVHGTFAAVSSYLLVLPLVLLNEAGRNPMQIAAAIGTACIVGGFTGFLRGRRRDPSA